jgi:MOSC domain-containing protein YiiM
MKSNYKIISLNVGLPMNIKYEGQIVQSAITKQPISGSIYLTKINFKGDKQADLVNHGGVDKAVCAYSYNHYSYWEKELDLQLSVPSFGENLTIEDLIEEQIHIGDIFQLGEAVLQVTQPRQPCYKLATKLGQPDMVLKVRNTGYSGYYFKVLEEGNVSVSDRLTLVNEDPCKISISEVNNILYHDTRNMDRVKEILQVEALAGSLRERLQGRLTEL